MKQLVPVEFLLFLLTLLQQCSNVDNSSLKPVVLIPGLGGSQVEAFLDKKTHTKHEWCAEKFGKWFTVWLEAKEILPLFKECWLHTIQLVHNTTSKRMVNKPGVQTRVPHFNGTSALEWFDPSVFTHFPYSPASYLHPLVEFLVKHGYKRGENLYGAPYDFRFSPNEAEEYFVKLKKLIEEAYRKGGRVVLVSHSMGSPYIAHFLRQRSQEWKDKYISKWISVSGALAGSVKILQAYISGYGFGLPSLIIKPTEMREAERTFPSVSYLLPDPSFWKKNEVLVNTPNRTYGISDLNTLFDDLKFSLAKEIFQTTPKIWHEDPPNVEVHCLYGTDVDTPAILTYKDGDFPDHKPDMTYDGGDGTVNIRSLKACERWKKNNNKNVTIVSFAHASHNGILDDKRLFANIKEILLLSDQNSMSWGYYVLIALAVLFVLTVVGKLMYNRFRHGILGQDRVEFQVRQRSYGSDIVTDMNGQENV